MIHRKRYDSINRRLLIEQTESKGRFRVLARSELPASFLENGGCSFSLSLFFFSPPKFTVQSRGDAPSIPWNSFVITRNRVNLVPAGLASAILSSWKCSESSIIICYSLGCRIITPVCSWHLIQQVLFDFASLLTRAYFMKFGWRSATILPCSDRENARWI